MQLTNLAQLQAVVARELRGGHCELSCTRGGPALVDEPRTAATIGFTGDPRRRLIPQVTAEWSRDDGGQSREAMGTASLTWRARSNLDIALTVSASEARHDAFFYRRFGSPVSDTTHYTFARLDQAVRSLTTRFNYTVTPSLSVQWYAQVYLSRGKYANVRELADPRARRYDDRFRPYADRSVTDDPGGVDLRQFRSNAVARWEYRPGSTLFVVWTQGRDRSTASDTTLRLGPDLRDLFAARPDNVVTVKLSYWLSR